MDSDRRHEQGGGGGAVLVVLLVASFVVILEGWFHAFEYADELALSILKSTGSFSLPAADGQPGGPANAVCPVPQGQRYVVVLVPEQPEEALAAAAAASSGAGLPRSDFRFEVVKALAAMNPAILAVDLDLTHARDATLQEAARERLMILDEGSTAGRLDGMRWVLTALPIDEEVSQDVRARRNDWLRRACERPHVVVGSPAVATSQHFGHVVQFHWNNLEGRSRERPPVFPSLGQLVNRIDQGGSERSATKGAGFVCSYLRTHAEPGARIPFIERMTADPADLADEAFVAGRYADRSFDLAWLNPAAALHEVHVASVRNGRELAAMKAAGPRCLADRIVFIGTEPSGRDDDVFATAVGPTTPGVLVHAMTAVSAEHSLKSRLALAAALDLLVGLVLTWVAVKLQRKLKKRRSFVGRTAIVTVERLTPLLMLAVVCWLSVLAFRFGWFVNPMVAALGIWMHGQLHHSFHADAEALAAWQGARPLPPWKRAVFRLFPPPRLSDSAGWATFDKSAYWVLVWTIAGLIVWAVWIVASRGLRLVLL